MTNNKIPEIDSLKPITIPGNAGDFIIGHQALPNGAASKNIVYHVWCNI